MPPTQRALQQKSSGGSLARKIGPAIPLGIALAHGAISPTMQAGGPPAQGTMAEGGQVHDGSGTVPSQCSAASAGSAACPAPSPLLAKGHPVDWFFVFKLNAATAPGCATGTTTCPFGGSPGNYHGDFSLQYAVASSEAPQLAEGGKECLGNTTSDPVGATFDEVYNGGFHYVVWNDQPYADPALGCAGNECGAPWGHSKGMLAWNDDGNGFVMQVSTPSWPLAGSSAHPRRTGNTLGCVVDNDVEVSQHFFALRLNHADVLMVLRGLGSASVVTDPSNAQVANVGGPADVQQLANALGKKSDASTVMTAVLSTNVELIVKPSQLHVPPWQMVSATLGGISLRTANWWVIQDALPSTTAETAMGCWDSSLPKPGAVEIASSGTWGGKTIGLKGGDNPDGNHAKIGVTTSGSTQAAIFGDENQEGSISGTDCAASQNGRGGMFYVVNDPTLAASVAGLIRGDSVPLTLSTSTK